MEIHPLLVQLLHCCYCQTGYITYIIYVIESAESWKPDYLNQCVKPNTYNKDIREGQDFL